MKEYTLTEQYAMIGLNGTDSKYGSMAKSAVLRGILAAQFLENILLGEETNSKEIFAEKLQAELKKIRKMSGTKAKKLEKEIASSLIAEGVMEEIQDILACDMNYVTAGVDIKAYRTEELVHQSITEGVRAEVLEVGPLTTECFCLLWLFRESGIMHDVFTLEEQDRVNEKIVGITLENPIYQLIWQEEFHSVLVNIAINFRKAKKNLFKNPYLEGLNVMYPFLDRRQAIFIDYVVLGTDVMSRRNAVATYLSERGHYVTEVKNKTETLLKVDNEYYRIFPSTRMCRLPIQGMTLVPVYK